MPRGNEPTIVEIEIDFAVRNHGSIWIVEPLTEAAQEWVDVCIEPTAQWWGRGFVVEPRYIADVVHGAEEAGLVLEYEI